MTINFENPPNHPDNKCYMFIDINGAKGKPNRLGQCKTDASKFIGDNIVNNFNDYPQFRNVIKELEFID